MRPAGRLLTYDLICAGAMLAVAAGVVMNVAFLQALSSDGPSRLVLIPVFTGLAVPILVSTLRLAARVRETRLMEAMGAGALLYLMGSAALSAAYTVYAPQALILPRPVL